MMIGASGGPVKPRHVSSGAVFGQRSASASRTSFSASVEDLTRRMTRPVSRDRSWKDKEKDESEEARRSFIGGIRKMSFGNNGVRGSNHVAEDSSDAKKRARDRDNDRRHRKSKSFVNIDTRALDIGNESIVSEAPPQIPDLSITKFPLSPIFISPTDPNNLQTNSNELLPAAEVEPVARMMPSSYLAPIASFPPPLKPSLTELAKPPSSLLISKVASSPQQSASLGRSATAEKC